MVERKTPPPNPYQNTVVRQDLVVGVFFLLLETLTNELINNKNNKKK